MMEIPEKTPPQDSVPLNMSGPTATVDAKVNPLDINVKSVEECQMEISTETPADSSVTGTKTPAPPGDSEKKSATTSEDVRENEDADPATAEGSTKEEIPTGPEVDITDSPGAVSVGDTIAKSATTEESPIMDKVPAVEGFTAIHESPDTQESPAAEESPTKEESPATNESQDTKESPPTAESPAIKESPTKDESPASGEIPAKVESPATEKLPLKEESPVTEESPTEAESPTKEGSPATEGSSTKEEFPATEESPAIEESLTTKESPTKDESSASREFPAKEKSPATKESPTKDESPAYGEFPAKVESPATEKLPLKGESPVTEESPVAEESPTEEGSPTKEEFPATEESPSIEESQMKEESPATEESPTIEESPTKGESPATEESPTKEESPATEESPAKEESPATEESPTKEESPATEESPTKEESPAMEKSTAKEESPATEESPTKEESPATEESPTKKESPDTEESPATEESPSEEESPTTEEAPAIKTRTEVLDFSPAEESIKEESPTRSDEESVTDTPRAIAVEDLKTESFPGPENEAPTETHDLTSAEYCITEESPTKSSDESITGEPDASVGDNMEEEPPSPEEDDHVESANSGFIEDCMMEADREAPAKDETEILPPARASPRESPLRVRFRDDALSTEEIIEEESDQSGEYTPGEDQSDENTLEECDELWENMADDPTACWDSGVDANGDSPLGSEYAEYGLKYGGGFYDDSDLKAPGRPSPTTDASGAVDVDANVGATTVSHTMPFHLNNLLNVRQNRFPALDLLLNLALFTPLVVLHYQSTCAVLDWILCFHLPTFGPCLLFVAGISVEFCYAYYQKRIPDLIKFVVPGEDPGLSKEENESNQAFYKAAASRLYTFSLTFISLAHMKAVTDLFLQSTEGSFDGAVKAAITSIAILCAMRASRNVLAPPLSLSLDKTDDNFHEFSTVFQVEPQETPESAFDGIATVGVAYSFNHLHWAGVTVFLDHLIFPNNFALSVIFSIIIGYGICGGILLVQYYAKELSSIYEKESLLKKVVFEDLYVIVSAFGVITAWRGLWMFFDCMAYYFPIYFRGRDVTPFASFVLSYVMLSLARLTGSLPYKGCDKDGAEKDGSGCIYPTDYFMDLLFTKEPESSNNNVVKQPAATSAAANGTRVQQGMVVRRRVAPQMSNPGAGRPQGQATRPASQPASPTSSGPLVTGAATLPRRSSGSTNAPSLKSLTLNKTNGTARLSGSMKVK